MKPMGTKHLRLKREGTGYYVAQWVDDAGNRHRRSFGSNRAKAEARFSRFNAEWSRNPAARSPDPDAPLTLARLWAKFAAHAREHYRRADGKPTSTFDSMAASFAHVLAHYGNDDAETFGPNALRLVRDKMVEGGALCLNVINERIRRIRHVFKWAAGREMIAAGVWHALQALEPLAPGRSSARVTDDVQPVPEADYRETVKILPPTLRAMVQFQYLTGARPGEVCRLTLEQLDVSGAVWIYKPAHHKTKHLGKDRSILIGPRAQAVIAPFLNRDQDTPLFTPLESFREHATARFKKAKAYGRVTIGREWRTTAYARAIVRHCQENGITPWAPNRLRHNAATRLRASHGLDVAQLVLGHASANTTEIYAALDLAKARKVIEKVG